MMSGNRSAIPAASVGTVAALAGWAKIAPKGAVCVYHTGALARDRYTDPDINALADTALLLNETRFLRLQQRRLTLDVPDGDLWAYWAVRSATGYAPSAIIALRLTSFEWRALKALRDRDSDISATRAVRDALAYATASSFDMARSMIEDLKERQLVEPAPGKGWQLSRMGLEALT